MVRLVWWLEGQGLAQNARVISRVQDRLRQRERHRELILTALHLNSGLDPGGRADAEMLCEDRSWVY